MQHHILDQDLYKLLMQQFLWKYKRFDTQVEYSLIFRSSVNFDKVFRKTFDAYIENFSRNIGFITPQEANYLETIPGLTGDYINWLKGYLPDIKNIKYAFGSEGDLALIIKGKWSEVIWFEVPLMAAISELYSHRLVGNDILNHYLWDYEEKPNAPTKTEGNLIRERGDFYSFCLSKAKVVEFGTRRRYSDANQERILKVLREYPCYAGTSNVLLAMKNGETPKGTMAHELFMGIAPLVGYKSVYEEVLNRWYEMYAPNYLIALTDTFTSKHFFEHVNRSLLYMYDGIRIDSGNPELKSFEYLNVLKNIDLSDYANKHIVYSNALTCKDVLSLQQNLTPFKKTYGIGTYLTNNVGITPLNMVIKLTQIDGLPTTKISDDPGKSLGPPELINRILGGTL